MKKLACLLFGVLGLINISNAAFIDEGGGLIYDSVQDITWMQDANLFKTLCDANDPLYSGWTGAVDNTKEAICSNNGRMSWFDAEAWISRLNSQAYLNFNDWRQPTTTQPDASCITQTPVTGFPTQGSDFRCTGSELGHLFNAVVPQGLGNPNDIDDNCFPPVCFQNTFPFLNPQFFAYWSGTEYAPDLNVAWNFFTNIGSQFKGGKGVNDLYVWPVRSGSTPSPVPGLTIWGLGLLMLLLVFLARWRLIGAR